MKAPELARLLSTTPAFLPQVVGHLVRAGWVRSDPGPSGGYSLSVDLGTLTVLQVVEAVDGEIDDGRCVVEARADTCPVVRGMVRVEFFAAMARYFVRLPPSSSAVLAPPPPAFWVVLS